MENKSQTTDAGLFVVAPLPPGAYQVNVSASAFRPYLQKEVIIDALGTVEMTVKLEVGAITSQQNSPRTFQLALNLTL